MKHFVHCVFPYNDGVLVQGTTLLDHADMAGGHVFQLRQWAAEVSRLKVTVKILDVVLRDDLDNMLSLPGDGSVEDCLAKAFWR